MSGLVWLNELMQWLGRWFPRPMLIKAGEVGVWFGLNGATKQFAPGFYVYWPITTEIKTVSTRQRTLEICSQLCGTEVMSVTVTYTIARPMTTLLGLTNVFSQLDDRTQAALGACYAREATSREICDGILARLVDEFGAVGVDIHAVDVIQRGWALPLKNISDWATHAKGEL